MEDDTSSDVLILDSTSEIDKMIEVPDDKPLMHLFKRLIGDSKQSTMLTNSQIINILQKELNLEIAYLHDLEVDIYLNLMKKFLKDWPQWDPFDRAINKLKNQKDYDSIRTLLYETHLKLKEYLKQILSKALPIMKEIITETVEKNKNDNAPGDNDDVLMETYCSRDQLNELILRRPSASNNIFNLVDQPVQKFDLSYKSILNWWEIQVDINLRDFVYTRETQHVLKHTLINKKMNKDTIDVLELNRNWQCRAKKGVLKTSMVDIDISDILRMINKIVSHYNQYSKYKDVIESIFEQISLDLNEAPDTIKLCTEFRRHMSKYQYVRYLYVEQEDSLPLEGNVYDLQLKEVVSPRLVFQLQKLEFTDNVLPDNLDWITVRCGLCKDKNVSFYGEELENLLVQHFSKFHSNEPEWQCVKCNSKINMLELVENRWEHTC